MTSIFNHSVRRSIKFAVLALAVSFPLASQAHRSWLLPSATVLSGNDPWITVDAAVSNELFSFEDFPLRLDSLTILGPDGKTVQPENASTGKQRSTFDVHLSQSGTYKLFILNNGLNASYKVNGQQKRWRGNADALDKEIPADATDLKITQSQGRIETFATVGKPTKTAFAITGVGLEMQPITHPNDLAAGNISTFQLLLDGKPAPGLKVDIATGGARYRDTLLDIAVTTDAEGKFSVKWASPGMYWFQANVADNKPTVPKATERRASYAATIEVLP